MADKGLCGKFPKEGQLSSERSSEFRKVIWVQVEEDGGYGVIFEHQCTCMSVEIGLSANSTTVLNWFCSFTWKVFLWAFR